MYNITSTWTELIKQFFPIFTTPGAKIFFSLMTGWILCTVRRTITGILPFADPQYKHAHDAYHCFLPDARWNMTMVWGKGLSSCWRRFYATLSGKVIAEAKIVSRMRRDADLYDLPPKRKTKRRGRSRTKGKKLAKPETMASHVQKWQMVTFRQRAKTIKRLVYTRVVLWYKVSRKPVLLVISRAPSGKEKDDFLFTTDVTMKPAEVLECFADRWPYHKKNSGVYRLREENPLSYSV